MPVIPRAKLYLVLSLLYFDSSVQRTLIGINNSESTVIDIIHGVGFKMCSRECFLRREDCRTISYDAEHLVCRLHSAIAATFPGDVYRYETIKNISKIVKGECAEVACAEHEKCIQLSNGTQCVKQDMPRDCKDVMENDETKSGMHVIFPFLPETFPVPALCDMDHDEGGHTVIHRRVDGSVNFTRLWNDYKNGFGDLESEFWLGNDVIHALTNLSQSSLYILLQNHTGATKTASYGTFFVSDETENYTLTLEGYSGTAGNSLGDCKAFSTLDRDNDPSPSNCVTVRGLGGWWFGNCCLSNLNGVYCASDEDSREKCNRWYQFDKNSMGMKKSLMMTRRYN